ncbi:fibronectin type III domain-containing protein [Patescibacteria group bacterium]|nr:fibronectin type III domain-containing protein [Patescibacteria group bacterium]MCH8888837.1 fibronectin type III domain-containing protein [Patescibacteria group bacterium]
MKPKFEDILEHMEPKRLTENEKKILWSRVERNIQPDVSAETVTAKDKARLQGSFWYMFSTFNYSRYVFIPALILAFLVGSVSTTAVFADHSQPGDFFFPFDIAAEKILLTITFGDTEDSFRLRFAEERIDEVKAILALAESVEINFSTIHGTSTQNESNETTTISTSNSSDNNASTTTSTNDNGVDLLEEEFLSNFDFDVNTVQDALLFALAQLEEAKAVFASQGNASGVAAVNSFIDELVDLAENHIAKLDRVSVTINDDGNDAVKIKIHASSKELKIKFNFTKETDGNGSTKQRVTLSNADSKSTLKIDDDGGFKFKFSFGGKKNDVDDDDDNNNDDNGDDNDDKDNNGKKSKKVYMCHKGENTIQISKNARWAHIFHGDKLGKCDEDDENDDAGEVDDETAPVLSNIVANATTTEATITWDTDEDADSTVFYSTTAPVDPNSANTVEDVTLTQSHSLSIFSLTASTTYYYLVVSADESGNTATSTENSFETTLAEPEPVDETAPVLSNIVANATTTEATITWDTDEDADSTLWYGTTTPIVLEEALFNSDATLTVNHSLSIFGLTASTTYYYIVISSDLLSNTASSTEQTFVTLEI